MIGSEEKSKWLTVNFFHISCKIYNCIKICKSNIFAKYVNSKLHFSLSVIEYIWIIAPLFCEICVCINIYSLETILDIDAIFNLFNST